MASFNAIVKRKNTRTRIQPEDFYPYALKSESMKEEIRFYIERSEKFMRNAEFNFENGDYDIAMFHIEQSMQLLIKAKLLDLKGHFERTHSLRKLLSEIKEIEGVERFLTNYRTVLRNLERAYITSRYYFEEFFKEEVEEAFEALKELKRILWKD